MGLFPVKFQQWFLEKTIPYLVDKYKAVSGSAKGGFNKNGSWIFNYGKENEAAYKTLMKDVWQFSCIDRIASSAASLPFGVYKRQTKSKGGDYIRDEEHKLTNLLENPNPYETGEEFILSAFYAAELTGKLYIQCHPNKQNPQELYVLDSRYMEPEKDSKKFVKRWKYTVDGEVVYYDPKEIVFLRYHNPDSPYEGLAGSIAAGDSINSDINSNAYNNSFYGNSAIPAAVLEVERRMTDPECDAMRGQWEKGHKGPKNAHKVAILYGGVKLHSIQKTPREMEFIKQKEINRQEILSAYGVPPVLVGLLESVNYSNSKEQKKLFWQHTMTPKLRRFAKKLTKEFGLDGNKFKFMFDLTEVDALQEDGEIKSRIAFNLSKGLVMLPDEIRRIFYKLPPLPDQTGNTLWVPTNVVPAKIMLNGPVSAPKAENNGPGKPSGPDADSKPDGQKPGSSNNSKPANKPRKELTDEDIYAIAEYLEKTQAEETNEIILVG